MDVEAWRKQMQSDFHAFCQAELEDADGSEEWMVKLVMDNLSAMIKDIDEDIEKYKQSVASRGRRSANIERGRKLGRWRQEAREHYKRPRGRWARGLRRSQGASVKAPNMHLDS